MNKEKIVEVCKKVYDYLLNKGLNSTIVKVAVAALFGIMCAYLLGGCTMTYKHGEVEYKGAIFTPIEYTK